ncbi:metallophosphoesterase [Pseudohalocynthiibacter aestuariivivens]|jgi:diadenosine tetraphosphatase ApaH/serine/threonine PP2A family protein phosphatase|uniref:Metallophosphoesterase n=1 Tax=Pseudohalocynthiibacter aestuariivivens TaxID=1591409 RepID=A0ABV5JJE7_9RHOB|nr:MULTISPECIES: metallophosphoesterase [Pseudohalocynthiibacter]MBS9718294.1 serine/threonine protein phosphatase [Pseudohalocynthiibacter aestuariivivens]MCK0103517.1 metallophosphoesterase [Pseudohalocynthiibacter sp. F2068]
MTNRTYAIGDIHGYLDKLKAIHQLIEQDRAQIGDFEAPVIHIGDLTDRGPDSRGVINYLLNGITEGKLWRVLKGNHDRMFAGFMHDANHQDPLLNPTLGWLHPRLGGNTTLMSYGIENADARPQADVFAEALAKVPEAHVKFLQSLEHFVARGDVFFAHAGIRPGVPLAEQSEDDLLWIRAEFHNSTADHGPLIVHGHTPVEAVTHYGNRLNIDTGAGYGDAISAVVLEGREVWQITPAGRIKIDPIKA